MTPQMNEDISSTVNEKIMDDEAGVSNVQEQGIVEPDTEVSEAMASEWPLDGWNTIFPTVLDTWMGEIPKASLRDKEGLYVEFITYEYLAIKGLITISDDLMVDVLRFYNDLRYRFSLNSRIMLTTFVFLFFVVVVIGMPHIYARCVLKRQARHREALRQLSRLSTTAAHVHTNEQPRRGLDAAVIATLPLFVYKGAEEIKDIHIEFAVCLSNLEDEEMARLLPNCKHTFHSQCIDTWLRVHSTCPICRTEAEPRAQPESIELVVVVPAMATAPPVDAINPTLPCSEGTSDGALGQSSKVGGSIHGIHPKANAEEKGLKTTLRETEFRPIDAVPTVFV
ncbi:hypothetical protein IFM89_021418 [Coptis chinensis]|uniref:RING-type E3 ubiquitin transferase n=1 Tax=Coptis chinensis TaxID=261450 RepID=A0A835LWK7_9MAGN|nr:hypothetical protein IFM89_021418 [Coptis chinensis]